MIDRIRERATYANVVSTLALFLVLTGGIAVAAALKKNSVKAKQIAPGAVGTSEAKDGSLQPGDLSFPIGASQAYVSSPLDPAKNGFTTIVTETINPAKTSTIVAAGVAAIQDNGFVPGSTTLTYRLLVDGSPEAQTYTTRVSDGESAVDPTWMLCNEAPAGTHTVELQVQANVADVTVGDRSLTLSLSPAL